MVFVASPGVTVDDVGDVSLTGIAKSQNGQHVYATVGQYDPINLAAGIDGPSPDAPDFGAHEFTSDSTPGKYLGWNPSAHDTYWEKNNAALTKMGKIIAGHGGDVG